MILRKQLTRRVFPNSSETSEITGFRCQMAKMHTDITIWRIAQDFSLRNYCPYISSGCVY